MAVLVLVQIDGVLGTDVHAGVGDTALAAVRDADLLGRAGVAGVRNDIHQGVLVVLLKLLGPLDILADGSGVSGVAHVQAHGQTHPLLHDGPLQEYVVTVVGHVALDHLEGNLVGLPGIAALKGQTGDLLEYAAADVVYCAVHSSHKSFLRVSPGGIRPSRKLCIAPLYKIPCCFARTSSRKRRKTLVFPLSKALKNNKHGGAPIYRVRTAVFGEKKEMRGSFPPWRMALS